MMLPYEIQLATRNLSRHPWHAAAMVLGLATAVLVMVYIPSSMASFYDDLIARAIEQNSPHVTVWPQDRQPNRMSDALRGDRKTLVALDDHTLPRRRDLNGQHALTEQIAGTPGVVAVAAMVRGNATVNRGTVDLGITIEGVDLQAFAHVVAIARQFPNHELPRLGPSEIAIGFRLAEKLAVHVGEHIHVGTAMTRTLMKVKAVFRSGYYDKDLHTAYVALPTAQRMFQMATEVSGLAARCETLSAAPRVSAALAGRLPHRIRNWRDDNASLLAEVATVERVTLFINVLVAIVAAVGMATVFSMFVLNRQKELAILRAIGASRPSLRTILMLEGLLIWLCGTIIGSTAALAVMAYEQVHPYQVSEETYGIASYATNPAWGPFLGAGLLALATMAVAAWWSGRKAARLNPARVIFGR